MVGALNVERKLKRAAISGRAAVRARERPDDDLEKDLPEMSDCILFTA
jgi:hypothetical protein